MGGDSLIRFFQHNENNLKIFNLKPEDNVGQHSLKDLSPMSDFIAKAGHATHYSDQ
jgi:hypothetical protein